MSQFVELTRVSQDHADPVLPSSTRQHLGEQLRALYGPVGELTASAPFQDLLDRLDAALTAQGEALSAEVRAGLAKAMPNLLAFALSLTRDRTRADDLVQETLLKAWRSRQRYTPDTNLDAWLFTILRNTFYSAHRKHAREVEDADDAYAATLSVAPVQGDRLALQDMQTALAKLPADMREALLLVTLNELTYDDAAAVAGCKVGTIKSRVSRARERLAHLLGYASGDDGSDWLSHIVVSSGKLA